nr:divergent polysaccharide deacetylase family protein [Desulfobacterales bacterium]
GWASTTNPPPPPPRIALIIDDIGSSRRVARQFMDISANLTFAVLPHLPFSNSLSHEIHALGCEILLHQPMEPFDHHLNPGPGAAFVGDSMQRIADMLGRNFQAVPYAIGVNNHMGSRFTSYRREIHFTLELIKRRGLFFVDSRTSHRSCAYVTARRINMNTGRRDTFLDNTRHPNTIIDQLYQLIDRALSTGSAIGIGDPYPETALALHQFCSEIQGTGVEIVPVSAVLDHTSPENPKQIQSTVARI